MSFVLHCTFFCILLTSSSQFFYPFVFFPSVVLFMRSCLSWWFWSLWWLFEDFNGWCFYWSEILFKTWKTEIFLTFQKIYSSLSKVFKCWDLLFSLIKFIIFQLISKDFCFFCLSEIFILYVFLNSMFNFINLFSSYSWKNFWKFQFMVFKKFVQISFMTSLTIWSIEIDPNQSLFIF